MRTEPELLNERLDRLALVLDEIMPNCANLVRDAMELLKEQEAVKRTSRAGINGFSIIWTCGACGSDLHPNNAKAKYCSNCGRVVKWDD